MSAAPASFRLATLNLWVDPLDRVERLRRLADWVLTEGVDVLCVQEVRLLDGEPSSVTLSRWCGLEVVVGGADATTSGFVGWNAVLSRFPCASRSLFGLAGRSPGFERIGQALAHLETPSGTLPVVSLHLGWGGANEADRLQQCWSLVERLGLCVDDPAIVSGDFNAPPDGDVLRFMTGRSASGPCSFFLDAWEVADGPGWTSTPENPYARATAVKLRSGRDACVAPDRLPGRRIDYVLSHGWRYGRAFDLFAPRAVTDPLLSDRYPVVVDVQLV